MKKKLGIRALAAILAASVVMSASTGMVSAKNGASVSATGDVSDTSAVSETTSRAAAKSIPSTVTVEGAALNGTKVPSGLSGAGTSESPYQIGSLSDLLLMNSYINYENATAKHFALTRDIDLSKVTFSNFTAADGIWSLVSAKASLSGNATVRFHLDGKGHKLYGMNTSVSKNVSTGAIFGYVNANSVIENLTVESCTLRVLNASDGAFAVLAVQNCGTIRNVTMKDCVLDARLANVESRTKGEGLVSGLSGVRVYTGHALGVADNAGKVSDFTVTGSDTNKGVFVKGGRRFVGVVAGQNRAEISDASVSGMRIVSYGSEDADTSVSGKGAVSENVGVVAGKNHSSATISSAAVTLGGASILNGDAVGGVVGENAGTIENATVTGTNANGATVTAASANLYGSGRYGAIAGVNSGAVKSSGAYDVGFSFAKNDALNAYGGICGANSGSVSDCVATGSVNLHNAASAGVGGLVGWVQSGATLLGNYAIVSASQQGANVGALVGKDGTTASIGQNNYWTSQGSGLATPAPGAGEGQNDLTADSPAIILTKSTSGVTLNASSLAWSWQGGKATAAADFSKDFTVSNNAIRIHKSTNSVTLSCTDEGVTGALSYTVLISVPAGDAGRKLPARVSVPIYVTASEKTGAGASAKNPIVITSAQQMQIMQHSPNAHYKLDVDLTLGSDWEPVDFGGTFDGAGHTLRIEKPLFKSVNGSRGGDASAADWKGSASNLSKGYIYDLTIVPTTCVSGGVFGDVRNATLRDVTYTVSDSDDGFVALSKAKSGALIDTLSGSVYLRNCSVSVPIAVTAGDADGIGALVGYAATTALVAENCETSSLISLENNPANVGGLFGNIVSAGSRAELVKCSATGCVYVPTTVSEVRAKIMIGAAASGVTASGCTYLKSAGVAGGSVAKEAAPFKDGIAALNPESEEAKQSAEDARSMLGLIDPTLIDEAAVNGLSLDNGVYKLYTAQDMLDMASQLDTTTAAPRQAVYELQNDIDMNGVELKMSTAANKQFQGTFRSVSGEKYTLSNFTVTGVTSTAANTVFNAPAALFCYASGATFQDIAIESVTARNASQGVAVLVGYADKGTNTGGTNVAGQATSCTFRNIDITDCTVISNKNTTGNSFAANGMAQAGTLIGSTWSSSAGDQYTIEDITVTGCTVENRNWDTSWTYYSGSANHVGGGAWAIGGLIGESRTTGTLCIGDASTANSIVLDDVTVNGYSFVGGVIGKAGSNSSGAAVAPASQTATTFNIRGGIKIYNAVVKNSDIRAGSGINNGGCCGGILGAETTAVDSAEIVGCTVSDTTIVSNNDISGVGTYSTATGGIAGSMGGLVQNCEVKDCTISSPTVGGIVARSTRKSAVVYDGHNPTGTTGYTLLTVDGCKVLGTTTITVDDSFANYTSGYEAGGIVSAAKNMNVLITDCFVGSGVTISGKFTYAGGLMGYATGAYGLEIENSVMLGTVEILTAINNSVSAGGLAYAGITANTTYPFGLLHIRGCVIGGEINNNTYYCGGVIGQYTQTAACEELIKDCTVIAKLQTTTESITKTADRTARLLAYLSSGTFITSGTNTNYWMRLDTVGRVFVHNIVSSYPYALEADPGASPAQTCPADYIPCFGSSTSANNPLMYTQLSLCTTYLINQDCIEDVNKPNSCKVSGVDYTVAANYTGANAANGYFSGAKYLHGSASAFPINGVRSATMNITNTLDSNTAFASRLTFDTAKVEIDQRFSGWMSTANGDVAVEETGTTATVIQLKAKQDNPNAGVTGNYNIGAFVDEENIIDDQLGTKAPLQISVCIPVICTSIPPEAFDYGDGTQADPYQIWTINDLNKLRQLDLSTQTYYILMADIDLTNTTDFTSTGEYYNDGAFFKPIIGKKDANQVPTVFKGVFLGNNKKIIGMKINNVTIGNNAPYAITALFAETDSATISDLTLKNAQINGATQCVGGLVGVAKDTTFTNITIDGTTVTGSAGNTVYAGALAAYVKDSKANGTTISGSTAVSNAYFTGGLYGHAHYTTNPTDNVIGTTTITGLTVTSASLTSSTTFNNYDNVSTSGMLDAAGGIAAEFAGTIGSYSYQDNNSNTVSVTGTLTISGTVTVTGANASAVVGFIDQTRASGIVCSITDVTVGASGTVTVTSETNSLNAGAGGIVGKIRKDDADNGTVNAGEPDEYVVPALSLMVDDCVVDEGTSISAIRYAGGVLGNSSLIGNTTDSVTEITNTWSFARVSASDAASAVGSIVGRLYALKGVWIDHCAAGGALSAQTYAAGAIGVVDGMALSLVISDSDYTAKGGILTNLVFSATFDPSSGSNPGCGVLIGDVDTSVLSNEESSSPFDHIYYSSYKLDDRIHVVTVENEVVTDDYVKLTGDERYADYRDTFIDLMENFAYRFVEELDGGGQNVSFINTLTVTRSGLDLGAGDIRLWSDGATPDQSVGEFWSFTCPSSVEFELEDVHSEAKENRINFEFTESSGTRSGVRLTVQNDGAGTAVFKYTNGLKLALDLIATDIPGHGKSNDPYLIERISHLDALRTFPDKVFYLAEDLDFKPTKYTKTVDGESVDVYYTAHGLVLKDAGYSVDSDAMKQEELTTDELNWANNWADWANALCSNGGQFTGTLDGKYGPHTYTDTNGVVTWTYNTAASADQWTVHTIKNLIVNTDLTWTNSEKLVDNPNYNPNDPNSTEPEKIPEVKNYASTIAAVGLFPILPAPANASDIPVKNLKFSGCTFSTAVEGKNVGVLVGESYCKLDNIEVDGGNIIVEGTTDIVTAKGTKHVGAVAGISYAAISSCTVKNATVTSLHCAGGIVGGGANVTGSTVTNVDVTGTEHAGGIAGGTLSFLTSGESPEVPYDSALRAAVMEASFTNCEVHASEIQSAAANARSSVGGILGIAESGYGDGNAANDQYRKLSIDHCIVDEDTTVQALAVMGSSDNQQNHAGGILGQLAAYYEGFAVTNCESYADVYSYGKRPANFSSFSLYSSASALVGYVHVANQHRTYKNGAPTYIMNNNICSGTVRSSVFAGGVCGFFGANADSSTYRIAKGDFACGNIISAKFMTLPDSSGASGSSAQFGILIGYCRDAAFVSGTAPSTMKDNYYSSDVSSIGDTLIKHFGNASPVKTCAGLYDVAARSAVNAQAVSSSLTVRNYEYMFDEETELYSLQPKINENNNQALFEDTVYAPRTETGEQVAALDEHGDPVLDENDQPVMVDEVIFPSNPLDLDIQFQYNTSMANDTVVLSTDFKTVGYELTVYSTNVAAADVRKLTLKSFVVEPVTSTFYEAEKTSANHALLTVKKDPDTCFEEHNLVADLGYGLLVKVTIDNKGGNGTLNAPYVIENEYKFAHYFFGDHPRTAATPYNYSYYKQVEDLDFDVILQVINKQGQYATLEEEFDPFKPIGDDTVSGAFYGGYNGTGHRIKNFHYEEPLIAPGEGESAYSYANENVGLFGYVADAGDNYHLKNLHIELKETPLDSDNMVGSNKASVCGGVNTGGLVGKYNSAVPIQNCSVVYGTVRSGESQTGVINTDTQTINVGGLVGWINGTATLTDCFTSTNVRAGENYSATSFTHYTGGGLVGLQTSGSAQGQLTCAYENCFSSSDVVSPYFVGGFVGKTSAGTTKIRLTDCACAATVTGLYQPRAGRDYIYGTTIVVGYSPSGSGVAAYDNNARYVQANNVLITGMNTTEFSHISSNLANQFYPTLFGTATLFGEDGTDAAEVRSGNVYYDASTIGRVTVPNGTLQPNLLRITNVLCDSSGGEIGGTAPFTAMHTDDLLRTSFNGLGSAWDASDGVLYPTLKMKYDTYNDTQPEDDYFTAFAKLAALPMKVDPRESNDIKSDRTYPGVTYPTTISKILGADSNAPALSIQASKYSAWSDTVPYDPNYDYLLSGNVIDGNALGDRADMAVDLLFNRGTDSTNTTEYHRTDARDDYQILRNTYLTKTYDDGSQFGYSFQRNEKSPFVRVAATVDGMDVHRTIHVGLRGSDATSYVATERQLRAISDTVRETAGTKFYYAYANTINYDNSHSKNIRLCADITFNPVPENRTSFTPIDGYKFTETGDESEGAFGFDGCNCEIRNLYISGVEYAGLFKSFGPMTGSISASDKPKVNNLILRNPDISGQKSVGALVAVITTNQQAQINNCMVIGGKVAISAAGGSNSKVGGLVGELTNVDTSSREIEQIGVIGVQISNASADSADSAGLVFGSVSDTKITNAYAVGELNVSANNVGLLAGSCNDSRVNRIVTSGYVINPKSDGNVGGIFGLLTRSASATAIKNAESTAFVSGCIGNVTPNKNNVGGIIGSASGESDMNKALIDRVVFAGSLGGNDGSGQTAARKSCIVANLDSATVRLTNALYNKDLQFTVTETAYNPTETLKLVSGSATGSFVQDLVNGTAYASGTIAKAVLGSGYTIVSDPDDPDLGKYKYTNEDGGSFVYDTSYRYYPNPVSLVSKKAAYGDIDHVITEEYKAGLSFALARINLAYAGTAGSVKMYDQITVTSPMRTNVFNSVIDNVKVSNDDEGVKTNSLDKVTLEEYNTNNTAIGSSGNGNAAYLVSNGSYLSPNAWQPNVQTGVRATLDTTTAGSTFKDVASLYRFLVVNVVRVVKLDYVIDDPNGLLGTEDNRAVLMLRTDDNGSKYSSSAVTSKFQDSDTSSGVYSVRYQNILATDNYIYVDAMLPSGYKISSYSLESGTSSGVTFDTANNRIVIPTAGSPSNPITVDVKLKATVGEAPSWGIRDLTGGIG